jgi:protein O-GlcNAc transferase
MTGSAEHCHRQGVALLNAGDFAGALAAFDAALALAPHISALHYDRGNALAMLRRLEQAVEAYDRSLALEPAQPRAVYNRAMALIQLQRWDDALAALDGLVARHPQMADAWNNRAGVLQALARHEDALQSMEQVLRLRPQDARTFYNVGATLLVLKRFEEAQRAFARTLQIDPGHRDALGHLASAALHACDWETLEPLLPRLFSAVENGAAVPPLTLLALSDDPRVQKQCAASNLKQNLAGSALDGADPPAMAPQAYHHDRIRIGYLSSDFGDHPVARQIAGLLERHDRSRFEIVGLFTGREDGSDLYRRIVKACDRYFQLGAMGSREAAALIRDSEIDILVDLNGQTMGWRPAILKYRPAPVSATFLGYAGTTGADFIDYIIGDPHVTPFELAPVLSEKIVQLPRTFWPGGDAFAEPGPVSRAEAGLPRDGFVFCCFNSNHKIRSGMFDLWARLLKAVPGSVLWLRDGGPAMNERFRREAGARGLDVTRLCFAGRMESFARHLGRQAQADLFLDTFPYNAHATASDALRAGLPVVTLQGQSFVSRVCAGLLANAGLDELIASSMEDYETKALSLARDRGRLSGIRHRLASARQTLFDLGRFTHEIEAAYLEMQARARRGERPEAFRVDA